ncbi:MAG: hypothetical protein KDH96_10825, partial [Candidatus Riesia sp.]|nr:hypothetical protein [Candidatus Riesia sp.]
DIVVNGNVGNAMTRNGNITCNKASGKIICDKLEASDIRGYVNTMGDVITDNFIGNTSVGEVIDNLIPIEESEIKEGTSIYHKKYGKGKIGYYYGHNHVSVNFEEGGYKSFQKDKVMANKSFFKLKQNNIHKAYDYESEMVSKF